MASPKPPYRPAAARPAEAFARPTPKVKRLKPGKVLSAAERAAFLAARPDLKPKG
jgi:hypothetical protein